MARPDARLLSVAARTNRSVTEPRIAQHNWTPVLTGAFLPLPTLCSRQPPSLPLSPERRLHHCGCAHPTRGPAARPDPLALSLGRPRPCRGWQQRRPHRHHAAPQLHSAHPPNCGSCAGQCQRWVQEWDAGLPFNLHVQLLLHSGAYLSPCWVVSLRPHGTWCAIFRRR